MAIIDTISKLALPAIPAMVGVMGLLFAEQQREIENLKTVANMLTSDNEREQVMGSMLAQHLAANGGLPPEMLSTLAQFSAQQAQMSEDELAFLDALENTEEDPIFEEPEGGDEVAMADPEPVRQVPQHRQQQQAQLSHTLSKAAVTDPSVRKAVKAARQNDPIRIFVHAKTNMATKLSIVLENILLKDPISTQPNQVEAGQIVPAVPNQTQIRCYDDYACTFIAPELQHTLANKLNLKASIKSKANEYAMSGRVRPNTLEIWISEADTR